MSAARCADSGTPANGMLLPGTASCGLVRYRSKAFSSYTMPAARMARL